MAHVDPTKSQMIDYDILINPKIIRHKLLSNYQK